MLLRNIYPIYDLCNGTRLLCRDLFNNMLNVEILIESNAEKRAFLHRIKLKQMRVHDFPLCLVENNFSLD
jgi:hypothetical protein